MARPAGSYRGARRNAWLAQKPRPPWQTACSTTTVPYRCKPPRMRYGTFQVGAVPDAISDVVVPYTDLRQQPRVYR